MRRTRIGRQALRPYIVSNLKPYKMKKTTSGRKATLWGIAILGILVTTIIISCSKLNNTDQVALGRVPTQPIKVFGKSYLSISGFRKKYHADPNAQAVGNLAAKVIQPETDEYFEWQEMRDADVDDIYMAITGRFSSLNGLVSSNIGHIVMYAAEGDSLDNLDIDDLVAVSFFMNDSNRLYHRFFVRNSSTFTEDTTVHGYFQTYTLSDFRGLGKVANGGSFVPSIIELKKENATDISSITLGRSQMSGLLYQSESYSPEFFFEPGNGKAHCTQSECSWDSDDKQCVHRNQQGHTSNCEGAGKCTLGRINDTVTTFPGLSLDTLSMAAAYDFRENSMTSLSVGRKYVRYYYILSDFTHALNLLKVATIADYYSLGSQCFSMANELQYGTDDNAVIVTSEFRSEVHDLVTTYKGISSNNYITSILDDIEIDLSNWVGLTKTQLLERVN